MLNWNNMSLVTGLKQRFSGWFDLFGDEDDEPKNIGIYGPPNTGKTTIDKKKTITKMTLL